MDIRGIVFDLGHTLIEYKDNWDESLFYSGVKHVVAYLQSEDIDITAEEFGREFLDALSHSRAQRELDFIERRTRDIFVHTLANHTETKLVSEKTRKAMALLYQDTEKSWVAVPKMLEVIKTLAKNRYHMGILSNAADTDEVHRLLKRFNLFEYFDPIIVSADVGFRKPDRRIFEAFLAHWDLDPGQIVMVGDTLDADIAGARQVGMHHIWIRRNAHMQAATVDLKVTADIIADSLSQVPVLIRKLVGQEPRG